MVSKVQSNPFGCVHIFIKTHKCFKGNAKCCPFYKSMHGVCVCVCVCAHVRACVNVCVCVCVGGGGWGCACAHACMQSHMRVCECVPNLQLVKVQEEVQI